MLDLDHAHVIEEGEVVAAPIAAGEEGDPVPSVRVGLARGRDQGHQASPSKNFRYLKSITNESFPQIPHTVELFDQVFVKGHLKQMNRINAFMMMR